ncbi:uncharacterized protein LOC123849953 isoform X2 [Mirounga angustirostris]|uniref:uncharacterized protein LOC123849953 isoform X2 n=1 Tax=Mirounga angustirostris TaxID=9716 RepID=UPI00313EF02D
MAVLLELWWKPLHKKGEKSLYLPNTGASLDKKLAASVNILPKASSLYFWNGEIEEATEILLLIKTKTSKVHVLSSYIRWETGSEAVGHCAGQDGLRQIAGQLR